MWQAPEVYRKVSPFFSADTLKVPLLIIHGADDANPGTTPLQSSMLLEAIRGNGGTARLVMLPHGPHWYSAMESNEQLVYEMQRWFDKYVKNAPPAREGGGALRWRPRASREVAKSRSRRWRTEKPQENGSPHSMPQRKAPGKSRPAAADESKSACSCRAASCGKPFHVSVEGAPLTIRTLHADDGGDAMPRPFSGLIDRVAKRGYS